MKAIVTGATGLVGSHLVNLLSEDGKNHGYQEILALGRNPNKLSKLNQNGINVTSLDLTADYTRFSKLDDWIDDDTIIFHCAAGLSGATEEVLEEVNIRGTEKLVRKAKELGTRLFILVSSISSYSLIDGEYTEDTEQMPSSNYGQSKLEQEKIVENSGLDYIIFRPPYIGGPGDLNFLEEFGKRIENQNMPTFTKQGIFGYIDARDLARTMIDASVKNNCLNEEFNIQTTQIKHEDFVHLMGAKMGFEAPYGPKYPYIFAMIIGFFGEILAKLRGKSAERGISRYRIRTLTTKRILNTDKIERILGYQPQYSIERSVSDWLETR